MSRVTRAQTKQVADAKELIANHPLLCKTFTHLELECRLPEHDDVIWTFFHKEGEKETFRCRAPFGPFDSLRGSQTSTWKGPPRDADDDAEISMYLAGRVRLYNDDGNRLFMGRCAYPKPEHLIISVRPSWAEASAVLKDEPLVTAGVTLARSEGVVDIFMKTNENQ